MLMVHVGGSKISRAELEACKTPDSSQTHFPVPHGALLQLVESSLVRLGYNIRSQEHALSHAGARYFGVLELVNGHSAKDYSLMMGLRNAHDKRFPASYCVGSRVFVCDNLAFSGDIKIARKHTRFIMRDLPTLVDGALGRLGAMRVKQDQRISKYQQTTIGDQLAHDLIIRAIDGGVVSAPKLPKVLQEWRQPKYVEFKERNVWSLFNAFTETLKDYHVQELPKRADRLHALMDSACGVN